MKPDDRLSKCLEDRMHYRKEKCWSSPVLMIESLDRDMHYNWEGSVITDTARHVVSPLLFSVFPFVSVILWIVCIHEEHLNKDHYRKRRKTQQWIKTILQWKDFAVQRETRMQEMKVQEKYMWINTYECWKECCKEWPMFQNIMLFNGIMMFCPQSSRLNRWFLCFISWLSFSMTQKRRSERTLKFKSSVTKREDLRWMLT